MDTTYHIPPEAAGAHDAALLQLTVNEALIRWPAAIGPLNGFGIDTCCGGNATLAAAAQDAGIAPAALLRAIVPASPEESR